MRRDHILWLRVHRLVGGMMGGCGATHGLCMQQDLRVYEPRGDGRGQGEEACRHLLRMQRPCCNACSAANAAPAFPPSSCSSNTRQDMVIRRRHFKHIHKFLIQGIDLNREMVELSSVALQLLTRGVSDLGRSEQDCRRLQVRPSHPHQVHGVAPCCSTRVKGGVTSSGGD